MNFIKKHKGNIIYVILLIAYAIFMLFRSPLSPNASIVSGSDSSVFMYMARGMNRGLVPYKDLFDHKGVLVYIINWLGIALFDGTIGIWILEVIFMLVNFIIIWKLVKLFKKSNMIAFFTILITFIPYITYYSGGNRVEEWAMPFILIVLYMCIKYLKSRSEEISKSMWIINGMATAAILWLKPNMIVVDIVFIGIIGIDLLCRKQYKNSIKIAVYFCLGLAIVSLPIVIYLISSNALKHCFNCYILFNLKYVRRQRNSTINNIICNRILVFNSIIFTCIYNLCIGNC